MYITPDAILKSISALRNTVHPFVGITFIACKKYGLSVGSMDDVSLDSLTRTHMDKYHKIDRKSANYFQPFRGGAECWVAKKYPSSGLQTVNTQTFSTVFLHSRGKQKWGFVPSYLTVMKKILEERNFAYDFPADALALWLLKETDIGDINNYEALVQLFFREFNIDSDEQTEIFSSMAMADLLPVDLAFSSDPLEMNAVTRQLPEPPDAETSGGRTIVSLRLTGVGPAYEMKMDFGERLTLITGDNGLGKSFLLDFAWWAATGRWADRELLPQRDDTFTKPEIECVLSGNMDRQSTFVSKYDERTSSWVRPNSSKTIEALAVFSRADGSFAFADPVRSRLNRSTVHNGSLSPYEVWNGRPGVIEGLIRDWTRWQVSNDQRTFGQFSSVLKRLSPEDLGTLSPGDPIRLPNDPRDIPTVRHRYGTIPVTHASAGVQRVLLLAYLIIWCWQEHELASAHVSQQPLRRMLVIVDELEAHLHPKWQRIVLPALIRVGDLLSSDLALQMIAATHSPMILASMEAVFNPSSDVLYHLYGVGTGVRLDETPFVKYGDASGWLTSPLFGLRHARSREAEAAIETAKSLQLQENPNTEEVATVSERLKQSLAADDKFWPRWLYFAEQHGVEL